MISHEPDLVSRSGSRDRTAWQTIRLKYTAKRAVVGDWGSEPRGDDTDTPCVRVADFECGHGGLKAVIPTVRSLDPARRQLRELRRGDLLLEKSGGGDQQPVGRVVMVDRDPKMPTVCSNFIARLRPRPGFDPRYLCYLHRAIYSSGDIKLAIRQTTGIQNLDLERYLATTVSIPPLDEQRRIADFLDAELARLHGLRDSRSRTIALLGERIRAIRAFLVLGEGQADLKDTGMAGLPRVPTEWTVAPLRRFDVEVQTGPFGSQLHASDYISDGIPVVNPANLQAERIVPSERATIDEATRERLARHVLRPGDVVFARRGELGRAALVTQSENGWLCGTGCLRVRFRGSSLSSRFLSLYLNLDVIRQYFESFSVGSTLSNLNSELLLSMPVVIPPHQEQESIADEVEEEAARHEELADLMSRQVDLMIERRDALITAAVTGQLDPSSYRASALAE